MLSPIDTTYTMPVSQVTHVSLAATAPRHLYIDAADQEWITLSLRDPVYPLSVLESPNAGGVTARDDNASRTKAEQKRAYNLAGVRALESILQRQFPALDMSAELVEHPGGSATVQAIVHVADPFGRSTDLVAKYVPDVAFDDCEQQPLAWRNGRVARLMQEAAMLQAAGKQGISPWVYRIDAEHGYFLQIYVLATRPSDELVATPDWQRRIAELTARVHALTPELPTSLDDDPYPRLKQERLEALANLGCLSARGLCLVESYISILKRIAQTLPQVRRAIHGDLQPGNYLHTEFDGRIYLIDFEHAAMSDPMADLAFFLSDTPQVEPITRALEAYASTGVATGAMAYERLCLHILMVQTRALIAALRAEHATMGPKTTASLQTMREGLALFATAPSFESSAALQRRHRQAKETLAELSEAIMAGPAGL